MTPEVALTAYAKRRGLKRFRLSGASAFDALFRAGLRLDGATVELIYAPAASMPGRVGFVIAKRTLARAVDRNRMRRLMRVAVARARPAIERFDLIVRVKGSCDRSAMPVVAAEAASLLARLGSDQTR